MIFLILIIGLYSNSNQTALNDISAAQKDFKTRSKHILNEIQTIIKTKFTDKKLEITQAGTRIAEDSDDTPILKKNIKALEDYLNKYPNSKDRADIIYQLAQLYYELSSNEYLIKSENFERLMEAGNVNIAPPSPNYTKSIIAFNSLIRQFPKYNNIEDTYYIMSQIYSELDNPDKARYYLMLIMQKFPKSPKIPEVAFRIAEHYFDIGNNVYAALYYSYVLTFPSSNYYENALYKIAWTYYQKRKVRESVSAFMNYVNYKTNTDPKSSLIKEALDKVAKSLADVEWLPNRAHSLLVKMGQTQYEFPILKKLCSIYAKASLISKLEQCVKQTSKIHPKNAELPNLYDIMVTAIEKSLYSKKSRKKLPVSIERLVSLFGEDSSWRKANNNNLAAIQTANNLIEKYLLKTALVYQKLGDKTKRVKYYEKAKRLYREFIRTHTESAYLSSAKLNYAKILYLLEEYQNAKKQYIEVANFLDVINKESAAATYYEAIVSFKMILMQTDKKYRKRIKISKTPKTFSKSEKEQIRLCNIFSKKYEKIQDKTLKCNVIYEKAEILLRNGHLKNAEKSYNKITQLCPNTDIYVNSLKNLISIYNWQSNFSKVQELSAKLMKSKRFLKKKEKAHYKTLLTGALFKSAKNLEAEGKSIQAADKYVEIAKKHPRSKFASSALFNAAIIYMDNNQELKGEKTAKRLIYKYPKDKLSYKIALKLALLKEQNLQLNEAIKYYKVTYKSKKHRKTSLYSMYLLYRALSMPKKAVYYLTKYKPDYEHKLLALQILKNNNKKNAFMRMAKRIGRRIPSNYDIERNIYRYQLTQKKYYLDKAYRLALKKPDKLNVETKFKLSKIHIKILETEFKQFEKIIITEKNINNNKRIYAKKEKYLNNLSYKLNKIISLADPIYSLQATYLLALTMHNFYMFLIQSPVPQGLSAEEKTMYTEQINTLAIPYKKQAENLYQTTIKTGEEINILSHWSIKAQKDLELLNNDQYKRYQNVDNYIYFVE